LTEPVEARKKGRGNKLLVPAVLLTGILLGALSSLASPAPEEPRFEHFPGFFSFNPAPFLQFHVFLTTIQIVLLVSLLTIYVKVYIDTRANFSLGLVIVLFALLLQALFSYPLFLGMVGPVPVGQGEFLFDADIFMIIAYSVFLYLSLE